MDSDYTINIAWDAEASVWIATCDDIPIALESGSLDALIVRVKFAAPELLELNGQKQRQILLRFLVERYEEIDIEHK